MDLEGFWSRIQKSLDHPTCQVWTGGRNSRGYGVVSYDGKFWTTHRLAWTLLNGTIQEGILVCHTCDNPICCNIEHLFLGTPKDNMVDAKLKGRMARGSRHGTWKGGLSTRDPARYHREWRAKRKTLSLYRTIELTGGSDKK